MSSSFQQQHQGMEMEMDMSISSGAPSPCVKGCGFFGSPGTMNMCSVCFTKHLHDTAPAAVEAPKAEEPVVDMEEKTTAAAPPAPAPAPAPAALTDAEIKKMQDQDWRERCRKAKENDYYKNRCAECFKKMGLAMRFECRCGKVCCLSHRNSEAHHCSFNYQRAGVISIIRDNPIVQADKLRDRI
ncbi:hypothetical protein QOZ80_5AG0402270 [Eleusine coracana subsp. coracana]|nr:hypothetical protein QOZ80_5AG0402270 [Eleusine coracana subsp. coracana]